MSPAPRGWQRVSLMGGGGDCSGEGLLAPPTKEPGHRNVHCCCTEVWYYQPHATSKWIKMPLTQQIKLTVK